MEVSEVKVGARRGDWEREIRSWKVTVVAASSIQVMGSSAAKHGRKREDRGRVRREENKCSTKEKESERERTVCSLDRIIAGGSGLTSSRITSTSPYLELCSSSCSSLFLSPLRIFTFTLRSLLLFVRHDLRIIMQKYIIIN